MNDTLSEPIESLRLVSDEEQQFAIFTLNPSSRIGGAQAAEICIYGEEAAQ